MMLHEKGWKAERDRAILNTSLDSMYTEQFYQASKDLYNLAPAKKARRMAVKMGLIDRGPSTFERLEAWAIRVFLDQHPERSEMHSSTREAQRAQTN